jgi:hypothetical protein
MNNKQFINMAKKTIITEKNYNEERYLESNPDVVEGIKNGHFKNGREHFDKFGINEGRMYIPKIKSSKKYGSVEIE